MSSANTDGLTALKSKYLSKISAASSLENLETIRLEALGKQGEISLLMRSLGKLDPEERKQQGAFFNELRTEIQDTLETARENLAQQELKTRLERERVDVTLPAYPDHQGYIHPLSQATYEMRAILSRMGFAPAEGPDIENDFNNFTALNIPEDHPAREEQDTFYMPEDDQGQIRVLRTHTSPVQIRTMLNQKPPIKLMAHGRVYRSDYDQTHTPTFHQIEGLYIDKGLNMGHLKKCIIDFCRAFFDIDDLEVRFRPSYFPFTEPSAEVDIACAKEKGQLVIGAKGDWLEVLGCGMVHPKVLENCQIDPKTHSGFAFGLGVERMAMLKYGIPDLRSFYDTDQRWLAHYGFKHSTALMGGKN